MTQRRRLRVLPQVWDEIRVMGAGNMRLLTDDLLATGDLRPDRFDKIADVA